MNTNDEKIIALETYIANVERELEVLNRVVVEQGAMIKALNKEIDKLKDHFKDLGETPKFEKPPHY
jgi:uncharacterized coiled-coil protein SlyX